jgi:hypothetical protein
MSPLTGVLTEAWALYRRFAGHFLLIAFVIYLTVAILVGLLSLAGWFGNVLGLIIELAALFLLQAALVKAVQDVRDGRVDLDLSQTFQAALPYLLPVAGAGILAAIGILIGLALLIVPGLILLTFWCLIVPFIVIEGTGPIDAFSKSMRTVRGYAWNVFGTLVLVFLLYIAFIIVLALILVFLPAFVRNFVSSIVVGTLVAPFLALVITLIYYRLMAAHASQPYTATSPEGATVWEPPKPNPPRDDPAPPPTPPLRLPGPPPPPGPPLPRPRAPGTPRCRTPSRRNPRHRPPRSPARPPRRSRPHHRRQAPPDHRTGQFFTDLDHDHVRSGIAWRTKIRDRSRMITGSALQLAFVDVHHGAIFSRPVGEAEALIQTAGGQVRLVDTDVHRVGTPVAGLAQGRLHERPSQALPPAGRSDIQLCQVTLQAGAPDGGAEAEHGQPVWAVPGQQDQRVAALKEPQYPFCQCRRLGRRLIEFPVEVVEQPPGHGSIVRARNADRVVHESSNRLRSVSLTEQPGGPRARHRGPGQHRTLTSLTGQARHYQQAPSRFPGDRAPLWRAVPLAPHRASHRHGLPRCRPPIAGWNPKAWSMRTRPGCYAGRAT